MQTDCQEFVKINQWASLLLPRVFDDLNARIPSLRGFIFVINRQKFSPAWKLPGGKRAAGVEFSEDDDASPLDTVMRETHEETGIQLRPEQLFSCGTKLIPKGKVLPHEKHLFLGQCDEYDLRWMSSDVVGNEGVEPHFFSTTEAQALFQGRYDESFLSEHIELIKELAPGHYSLLS